MLAAALVVALLPVARDRARFIHGEISYGRDFARQVDRLQVQLQPSGFDPHHVEHVADKPAEAFALTFNIVQQRRVSALVRSF